MSKFYQCEAVDGGTLRLGWDSYLVLVSVDLSQHAGDVTLEREAARDAAVPARSGSHLVAIDQLEGLAALGARNVHAPSVRRAWDGYGRAAVTGAGHNLIAVVDPRPEEKFIAEALRRILGACTTDHDDGSSDAQPDWLLEFPDGQLGALEVTTLGKKLTLQLEGLAARERTIPGARHLWQLNVPDGVGQKNERQVAETMNDAHRIASALALACEAHGVTRPEELDEHDDADWFWYRRRGVRLYGFKTPEPDGRLIIVRSPLGGWLGNGLDALPAEVDAVLDSPDQAQNLAKLAATGRPELHLAFRVHDTGLSAFDLYNGVVMTAGTPTVDLTDPHGLAGVWLFGGFHNPVLWWSRRDGWRRDAWLDPL